MDRVQSNYQRSCVVISGDVLEDWKYVFREMKTRVGVSNAPKSKEFLKKYFSSLNHYVIRW